MAERFLLDTVFIQALLSPRDPYHQRSVAFFPRVRKAAEVWVTESVLAEVGDALSNGDRAQAVRFIEQCYQTTNIHVVNVDKDLFQQALALYTARPDKTWGLTDCISFIVMRQKGLWNVVTADQHFVQADYRALLLEDQ